METLVTLERSVLYPLTLTEMKEHLRIITSNTDEDTYLQDILQSAVGQFQSDTDFIVLRQKYRYDISEFPDDYIELPLIPLNEIDTFEYYENDTDKVELVEGTDFTVISGDNYVRLYPKDVWPVAYSYPNALQITFYAGVTLVTEVGPRVKHALKFLLTHYHENRQSILVGASVVELPQSYESIAHNFKRYRF